MRLTKRVNGMVFFNEGVISTEKCPEYVCRYCRRALFCKKVEERKCPFLMVLDKLADFEDAEEQKNT